MEGQDEPVTPLPSKDEDDRGLHRFRYDSCEFAGQGK